MAEDVDEKSGVRRLVDAGVEIAGGAVGGAMGFLAAGPGAAALLGAGGVAAAIAMRQLGEEASKRMLGPREQVRVGGMLVIAAEQIRRRIEGGEQVRTDGFFQPRADGRSEADEVVEAVMLKCQREPQEQKVQYMASLVSDVAFDPTVGADMAHQLIKAAEQLTYRQLCLMKLMVVKQQYNLRCTDYRNQRTFAIPVLQILYECLDLYHRGFIHFGGSAAFGVTDVLPAQMTLQGLGAELYNRMRISAVPDEHVAFIAAQLA